MTRRRAEIGIRMALGARRHDIVRLTVRRTAVLTVAGIALGLFAAAALTRYLEGLLFGLTPLDPLTFAAAPALLLAVVAVAALIPARRAASADPALVLRAEQERSSDRRNVSMPPGREPPRRVMRKP